MDKFIKQLVRDAGKITKIKFGKIGIHHTKANKLDVVTEADLLADKLITSRIKQKFPYHAIISEESGEHNKHKYKWIIDPLDGTNNFSLGIPAFVTQIAFTENDKVKLAAIYDAVHDKLFFAEKGKGSYLNGKKINASINTNFEYSQGCTDFGLTEKGIEISRKILDVVHHKSFWIRNFGSSGVHGSYVSQGSLDWMIMRGCQVWDYAPASLLVSEAGGLVKNMSGKDWVLTDDNIIGGNPMLVKRLLKILNTPK